MYRIIYIYNHVYTYTYVLCEIYSYIHVPTYVLYLCRISHAGRPAWRPRYSREQLGPVFMEMIPMVLQLLEADLEILGYMMYHQIYYIYIILYMYYICTLYVL